MATRSAGWRGQPPRGRLEKSVPFDKARRRRRLLSMDTLQVAMSFVEAINGQRLDRIAELMTEGHAFVQADGVQVEGRDRLQEAWAAYFNMVPDYRIDVRETFCRENTVVLLGTASGTFADEGRLDPRNHWSVPAAWRVLVEANRVSVWQLYVDSEPMTRILNKMKSAQAHL